MAFQDLLDKITALPEGEANVPEVPPAELVGFVVRWNRELRQWKQSTLADFARVSVSTVERVERGERVSGEALDRIAQGLGYEAGYFTRPRVRLTPDETLVCMSETYGNMEAVRVAPMRTHRAIRDAAQCDIFMIYRPDVPPTYDPEIQTLGEWLDLASFVLTFPKGYGPPSERGRRALYDDIIGCIRDLERRGLTVLSGVMDAPQEGIADLKVAIISITPKLTDPGAPKRRHLMVDRRVVALNRCK
jgi:transcriptional regulator with XRE-family HTH domain